MFKVIIIKEINMIIIEIIKEIIKKIIKEKIIKKVKLYLEGDDCYLKISFIRVKKWWR